jgi:TatA/E family protein of Tat protein translocase
MGTLGVQEMLVIFLVALVLFGPKKLPELGRTIGKALTEFRRASNDLKATFDREMQTLERESMELKETTRQIASDIQSSTNIDYSSFDLLGEAEPSNPGEHSQPAHDPSTVGASAVPGAESNGTTATVSAESHETTPSGQPAEHSVIEPPVTAGAIEGTVPRALVEPHPVQDVVLPPVDNHAEHAGVEVSQHS